MKVASFVTIEEDAKQIANQKKTEKEKAKRAAKKAAAAAESGQEQGGKQKQLKDLSHIQRFKCKEFRHFSTSPDCPKNQEKATSSGYLSPEEVVHLLIDGNVPRDTKTNGSRCEGRI